VQIVAEASCGVARLASATQDASMAPTLTSGMPEQRGQELQLGDLLESSVPVCGGRGRTTKVRLRPQAKRATVSSASIVGVR
jgi:hypothetical protein